MNKSDKKLYVYDFEGFSENNVEKDKVKYNKGRMKIVLKIIKKIY